MSNQYNIDNIQACFDAHRDMDLNGSEYSEAILNEAEKKAKEYIKNHGIEALTPEFVEHCKRGLTINFLTDVIARMYDEVTV